jgi:hypothetical protein
MPFVEGSWLLAGGAARATVPAFALCVGVRFDLEGFHGDHPDRR